MATVAIAEIAHMPAGVNIPLVLEALHSINLKTRVWLDSIGVAKQSLKPMCRHAGLLPLWLGKDRNFM